MYWNTPSWNELCRKDPYYAWKDIESARVSEDSSREAWVSSTPVELMSAEERARANENAEYARLEAERAYYATCEAEPTPEWKIASDKITQLLSQTRPVINERG